MKAKVTLLFTYPVTAALLAEIKSIAGTMTPDKRTISFVKNLPDNQVEVIFERFPGRQIDIVDSIGKPYSLFLENLSDILIEFESRRKKI